LWSTILAGRVHTGTVINRKKHGELYHAEQTITPIKDASGNLTHFVSVVRDVTALKRAEEREVELRLARVVQQKLYPSRPPRIRGFDVAGAAYPADVTCGDYFDFIPMVDDTIAVVIGDVSGHGFASALLMAQTRAYLRSLARATSDPAEILSQVNTFLDADTEAERFVTLMLLRIDPRRRSFVYASAGHTPGYVIGPSGDVRRELGQTGMPLGLFSDAEFFTSDEIGLEGAELVLLLTDGITETTNTAEEFFGEGRALEVVRGRRHRAAREIVEELHAATREFAGPSPQVDDITAVVCKVLAGA
jgi:sigma-B regulation protein RsbU (phosphoserine phosphatase)